ncbi:MAG: peptide chain release factor N(5)-glutamine methyltransferase [Nocardioidaceae bacterium]
MTRTLKARAGGGVGKGAGHSATYDVLARAAAELAEAGVEAARHDAESLLAWSLGITRTGLMSIRELDCDTVQRFRVAIARRATREPLQHITGRAAFRYLDLEVGPGVFVPRPETELVAGQAIAELRRIIDGGVDSPVAVDLCTGSGPVALAMATEAPGCRVTGIEISALAHAYAERNASGSGVEIRLGDIAEVSADLAGVADVVTANPPYIPLAAFESVAAEARDFDPPVALWSGVDGLDAIRVVAKVAARLLRAGGLVLCEHADAQGETAPDVFAASGDWTQIRDHLDLAGRPRFVTARRVCRSSARAGTIGS